MAFKIPQLNQLEAFCCAAEALSFKNAAEVLHRTPSAISHAIKALETELGFDLFIREKEGVSLSQQGAIYFHQVAPLLQALSQVTHSRIREVQQRSLLKITSFPFFNSSYLIPHVAQLQQLQPQLELCFDSQAHWQDVLDRKTDIKIGYGDGSWPNLVAKKLWSVSYTPVCTAQFMAENELKKPEDVNRVTVISQSHTNPGWDAWLNSFGASFKPSQQLVFDNYYSVMDAVAQGLGVGLAVLPMVKPWCEQRQLIMPFKKVLAANSDSYVAYRKDNPQLAMCEYFVSWLSETLADEMN